MKVSAKGLALIRKHEGLRLDAYLCPAGVWTIGYGHTSAAGAPTVVAGMRITREEANAILARDLAAFEAGVAARVKVPLSQGQFDALVSFAFNVGLGAFGKSSLLRVLNRGAYDQVPAQLMRWSKANGRELPGLVRRRREEAALWRELREAEPNPPAEPVRQTPEEPKPAKTMAVSREGWAGVVAGAGGLAVAVREASDAAKQAADNVSAISAALGSPVLWIAAAVVAAGLAVWFLRRQRLQETGL